MLLSGKLSGKKMSRGVNYPRRLDVCMKGHVVGSDPRQ